MNPSAYLEIARDGPSPRRHWLSRRAVIGRAASSADIVLNDPSVSRKHAEVFIDLEGRWALRDLDSHNGTTVNGEQVALRTLNDGDEIAFGGVIVRFVLHSESQAAERHALEADLEADDDAAIHFSSADVRASTAPTTTISADHVMSILAFGQELNGAASAHDRLQLLLRLAVGKSIGAYGASALRIVERADGELEIARSAPPVGSVLARPVVEPRLSRSVLREALHRREPVVATHGENVSHFGTELSAPAGAPAGASSYAAAAFILDQPDERSAEMLYVTLPAEAANVQWVMLLTLAVEQYRRAGSTWAGRAAAEERAIIAREMELATSIQSRTLPRAGAAPALEWAIMFEPSRSVGGDYVDVVTREDGTVLLIIADVSGKGVQAALVTAGLHAIVHTLGLTDSTLHEFILDVQRYLQTFLPDTSFVTCAAILLDLTAHSATCINCGHPPFLAVAADGAAHDIGGTGANYPLGVGQDVFVETQFALLDIKWLIGVTDGLTEMRDPQGNMLGPRQLANEVSRVCAAAHTQTSADVVRAIEKRLKEFRGDADAGDDQTMLAVRLTTTT